MSATEHATYAGGPAGGPPPGPPGPPADLYPPLPFHELHRAGHAGAWRPLVGLVVCAVCFVGLSLLWLLAYVAGGLLLGRAAGETVRVLTDLDDPGPLALSYLLTSIALFIPLTWALTRWLHGLRPRWTTSVAPRMRWGYFAACLGLSLVALVVTVLLGALLPGLAETEQTPELEGVSAATRDLLLVAVLFTPLQAAGEEYLFRGYIFQTFGSLFGGMMGARTVSVTITALLFAFAHGSQDLPLFLDRFAFGVVAGICVIATGGIEAGIAMHVLIIFVSLGMALAFGDISTVLNTSEGSWWRIPVTLVQSGVFLGLTVWAARSAGISTTTKSP